jgi:hypothetical protein
MHYSIITGTGRSGTSWLLDIFDASPQTHCRNEPHDLPGTELNRFPSVWRSDAAGSVELYRKHWDDVAGGTARRFGKRDHNIRFPKPYLYPWSNHLGLARAMTGGRARAAASIVDRRLAGTEWDLPRWIGSRRRLEESLAVLKIIVDAPLLGWLVTERPQVPVIHIVRHPGGRMHSWLTRLVEPMNQTQRQELRAILILRIQRVRAFDARWRTLIPEPSSLSLFDLGVWFWRYVNESLLEAGRARKSYRLVRFEQLASDPIGESELLYAHLGLDWNDRVADRINSDTSRSVFGDVKDSRAIADAWRRKLDSKHVEAIDRILGGSPLQDLLETGRDQRTDPRTAMSVKPPENGQDG